jgi:hypothetical protein
MKTYYLQYNEEIPHKMIDTVKHSDYLVLDSVDSESWILAKKALGYPLTDTQELMLDY